MAGILDRLAPKKNQIVRLDEWLSARPKAERAEWIEALTRADLYSTAAILELLVESGLHDVTENAVVRYRRKLPGYVSAR